MSSDLLAEFDSFYQSPSEPSKVDSTLCKAGQVSEHKSFSDLSSREPFQRNDSQQLYDDFADQDADDWGAFESFWQAEPDTTSRRSAKDTTGRGSSLDDLITLIPTEQPAKRQQRLTSSQANLTSQHDRLALHTAEPTKHDANVDVLFDAETEINSNDEDFGDFESVKPEPLAQIPRTPPAELWPTPARLNGTKTSLDELRQGTKPWSLEPFDSLCFQERNPFAELSVSTQERQQCREARTPMTAWPSYVPSNTEPHQNYSIAKNALDDEWVDFTDSPAVPGPATGLSKDTTNKEWAYLSFRASDMPLKDPNKATIEAEATSVSSHQSRSETFTLGSTKALPPNNIPPPSILLSLFPPLFSLPQTTLFAPLSNQSMPLKDRILSNPSILTFLRGYLLLATVCAHVIAGRKLRWKRDTLLSQGMKISSAQSSKKSGMKLAGIDKAENLKEQREVGDLVRLWKEQLGKLRSVVAAANATGTGSLGPIPEIADVLPVSAAKAVDGAVLAEKACVLCGLKRDERVGKVDVRVEDTFGEWWVEHWGHTACRNFWNEHKDDLRQR